MRAMKSWFWILTLVAAVFLPVFAETPLPVRKVVLYKNGMAYFEHQGTVSGTQVVEIPLTSRQLDDVLKSLTALDLNGGRIEAVTFESAEPLDRRLGNIPIELRSIQNLLQFLNQLRGVTLEVDTPGGSVSGRLLSAELRSRIQNGVSEQWIEVALFSDSGELKVAPLESSRGLRFVSGEVSTEIQRLLELLASEKRRDSRSLRLSAQGQGNRSLFVSYTSEAPVWKTTYRVVLKEGRKPYLQGWAVVDNTTSLPWDEVQLSLVSGAPISFIHRLSEPLYTERVEVPVLTSANIAPRIYEETVVGGVPASLSGEARDTAEEAPASSARQLGRREALASEAKLAFAAPAAPLPSEAIRQAVTETARGVARAGQFEYSIPWEVSIGRNQSALLPILQADITAEKISVYSGDRDTDNPRLAIWFQNDTGLTLDGGAFTVVDEEAWAGEGLFETVQPAERRLVSYAVDLNTTVSTTWDSEVRPVERVSINRGLLKLERKTLEKKTYSIRNKAASRRTVLIEHPHRPDWKLASDLKPEETSENFYRLRVEVPAGRTTPFAVTEERPTSVTYQLASLSTEQVALMVRSKEIDQEVEKALGEFIRLKRAIETVENNIQRLTAEETRVFRDQERIRENLSRLGRNPEEAQLRQRYIDALSQQEDRLAQVREELSQSTTERQRLQSQLEDLIGRLSFTREM